jgi:hypothetical protein
MPRNSIAAVSADGSTVCVLILRLNSSCSRLIALVLQTLRHWLDCRRKNVNSRLPPVPMRCETPVSGNLEYR